MNYPFFSVIIPLYNKERHIRRAVNSVLNQSVQSFEILIIDDGSTDKGFEIVKQYTDERIRYYQQPNSGVSNARNNGINFAKYDLVAFLDADDEWEKDFLMEISALIEKFPEAGAYVTAYKIVRINNKIQVPHFKHIPKDKRTILPNYFRSMIYGDPMITSSSICIRKDVFNKAGYFSVGEKLGEDKDMWARIALLYKIAFSWYIGATYFENADNRTCLKYIPNYERYFIKSLQNKLNNNEVPDYMIKDVSNYISRNLIMLASKNIKTGNPAFAIKILNDKRCNTYYFHKFFWKIIALIPFNILFFMMKKIKSVRDEIF
ncbi:MAG: glycosyltransferase family 2 protein [Bacteroidales bacterium]|nr:glycosyltransferase family 2 protein [Bacteroidales bacterium]